MYFGTYTFSRLGINELIEQSKELPKDWDSDGASGLFAVFFGWLLSFVYFAPWLVIYILTSTIKRLFKSERTPNKRMQQDSEESHR